jgi:DNA-binding MarR family transcriptional regulator
MLFGASPSPGPGNTSAANFVRLANYKIAVPKELRVAKLASLTAGETATGPVAAETPDEAAISGLLTMLRVSRVMERLDAGVSPQQYRILKLIGAGGERSARLAEKLAVARPTLTSIGDSLVAAGLARRQAEPGDRRVVRLYLTEAGEAAIRRADEAYAAWFGSLLDYTGERTRILADLELLDDSMTERRLARLAGTEPEPASARAQAQAQAPASARARTQAQAQAQAQAEPRAETARTAASER